MPYIYHTNPILTDTLSHGVYAATPTGTTIVAVDRNGYVGSEFVLKGNFKATVNPAVGNDSSQGYAVGSEWWNLTAGTFYKAASVAVGAANWKLLG